MNNSKKNAKATLFLPIFSLIIASISLAFSIFKGTKTLAEVTIFLSALTIFCCSVTRHKSHKNNKDNLIK